MDPNDQNPTDQPVQDAPATDQMPPMDAPVTDSMPPVDEAPVTDQMPPVEVPVGDSAPQGDAPTEGEQSQGEVMPPPPVVSDEPASGDQPA